LHKIFCILLKVAARCRSSWCCYAAVSTTVADYIAIDSVFSFVSEFAGCGGASEFAVNWCEAPAVGIVRLCSFYFIYFFFFASCRHATDLDLLAHHWHFHEREQSTRSGDICRRGWSTSAKQDDLLSSPIGSSGCDQPLHVPYAGRNPLSQAAYWGRLTTWSPIGASAIQGQARHSHCYTPTVSS
jgi:hypothetical protein